MAALERALTAHAITLPAQRARLQAEQLHSGEFIAPPEFAALAAVANAPCPPERSIAAKNAATADARR